MGLFSRLKDAITRRPALTRDEVFDLARQDKFTGAVTFHFRDGRPLSVATGAPYQTELVEEECIQSGTPLTISGTITRQDLTGR